VPVPPPGLRQHLALMLAASWSPGSVHHHADAFVCGRRGE